MDELNVTPQSPEDQPEGNSSDQPAPSTEASAKAFKLEGEQTPETKPSIEDTLLQPTSDTAPAVEPEQSAPAPAMEEQSNPAQLEETTPSVEEEPEAMVATAEEPEKSTPSDDSVLNTNETPKKGGIPKWALIAGGVLGLGVIVVGAMFATDNWPFKGQLSPELLEGNQSLLLDSAAPEYCPDGQYYDAGETTLQNSLRLLDDSATTSGDQSSLRLLNAIPSAKAQDFNVINSNLLDAKDETTNEAKLEEASTGLTTLNNTINSTINTLEDSTIDKPVFSAESEDKESGFTVNLEESKDIAPLEADDSTNLRGFNDPIELEATIVPEEEFIVEGIDGTTTLEKEAGLVTELGSGTIEREAGLATELGSGIIERETVPLEVKTPTLDRTKCKPVPPTDCDLISKLLESPEAYFISPATLKNLNDWKTKNCSTSVIETRTPIVTTCGENQELEASSNECACKPGYFELESAASYAENTDGSRLNPIDSTARDIILAQAKDATLLTENPQNTLTLLDGNSESTGLAINNNLSGSTGLAINQESEESTGLAINRNLSDLESSGLRVQRLECLNCEELQSRIDVLKKRLDGLEALDLTADQKTTQKSVLTTEVERLEAKATKENCGTPTFIPFVPELTGETQTCDELVEQIVKIQGYPTASTTPEIAQELAVLVTQAESQECKIPEKDACVELAEESSNRISLGDFRGSFSQQLSYLDTSCIRALDPCDAKLAYATVAKEYRSLAIEAEDTAFFEQEFITRRDDYMNDLACVPDKPARCTEIESQLAEGYTFREDGNLAQASDLTTRNDLLLLDGNPEIGSNNRIVGGDFARETNLLSQTNLDQRITENLESRRVLNDKEYQDLYCQPFVTPRIGEITPIVSPQIISPAAPESPVAPPVNPQPPVSPVVSDPVENPVIDSPTPEEELSASAPDSNFQAPAAPNPDTVETGESSITPPLDPPTDTTELAAAAEAGFAAPDQPSEPGVVAESAEFNPATPDTIEEMPSITETPLITKTGPETFVFFFAFLASQMYYFRRRIYAFVENR